MRLFSGVIGTLLVFFVAARQRRVATGDGLAEMACWDFFGVILCLFTSLLLLLGWLLVDRLYCYALVQPLSLPQPLPQPSRPLLLPLLPLPTCNRCTFNFTCCCIASPVHAPCQDLKCILTTIQRRLKTFTTTTTTTFRLLRLLGSDLCRRYRPCHRLRRRRRRHVLEEQRHWRRSERRKKMKNKKKVRNKKKKQKQKQNPKCKLQEAMPFHILNYTVFPS